MTSEHQLEKEVEAWEKFNNLIASIVNNPGFDRQPQTQFEADLKAALGAVCSEYLSVLNTVVLEKNPWLKQRH